MTVLKHKFNHSRITIPKSEQGKEISRGIWRLKFECVNITNGVVSQGESYFFDCNLYVEAHKLKNWLEQMNCELTNINFETL